MEQQGRWPGGARAAISFTMDNLGEAQDVNKGLWPPGLPIGKHFSVLEHLPRMLDLLDKCGIKATFFAEAWSLGVYGDAVAELLNRGHEVAWHGYQHETWSTLSEEAEADNFRKSFAAADEAGVKYDGFRPPGGTINPWTYRLLGEHGVKYVSPLGDLGVEQGLVVLPFEWETVDAFYYMDKFASIRKSHGRQEGVLQPSDFREYLFQKIADVISTGGYISILFHPFLQTSEERFDVLEEMLARIGKEADIWCAPCREVAEWVLEHPSFFGVEQDA